jgi:hypothetical protein
MFEINNQIRLEQLIKQIFSRYSNVAEIYVAHIPSVSDISQLHITVHTAEVDSYVQSPNLTVADEATVRIGEDEELAIPFAITVTCDGPGHPQASAGTTVYVSDDVKGAKPRYVEDGTEILREKLAGRCPSCKKQIPNLGDHLSRSSTCREYERV